MTDRKVLGWWFAPRDNKLSYDDGRKVRKGITHKVSDKYDVSLCYYGLHASINITDACGYSQHDSSKVWRVELTNPVLGQDKMAAHSRKYLYAVPRNVIQKWTNEYIRKELLSILSKDNTNVLGADKDIFYRFLKVKDKRKSVDLYHQLYDIEYSMDDVKYDLRRKLFQLEENYNNFAQMHEMFSIGEIRYTLNHHDEVHKQFSKIKNPVVQKILRNKDEPFAKVVKDWYGHEERAKFSKFFAHKAKATYGK